MLAAAERQVSEQFGAMLRAYMPSHGARTVLHHHGSDIECGRHARLRCAGRLSCQGCSPTQMKGVGEEPGSLVVATRHRFAGRCRNGLELRPPSRRARRSFCIGMNHRESSPGRPGAARKEGLGSVVSCRAIGASFSERASRFCVQRKEKVAPPRR